MPEIDWTEVERAAEEYYDYILSDEYHEDEIGDYAHDIFENVMTAVYGQAVWDLINEKMK